MMYGPPRLARACRGRSVVCLLGVLWLVAGSVILFHVFTVKMKTAKPEVLSLPEEFLSPFHTKFPSLEYCSRRIKEDISIINSTHRAPARTSIQQKSDYHVLKTFSQLNCRQISALFTQSQPTDEERDFPLAYVLLLYKGAGLFVKQLQFIYMPQNLYCIHIDTASSTVFVSAVEQIARCLPNVFVTKKRVKVIYLHVSTVRAQLNCIEDLLESSIPWRYMFNLCGQDFPLYSNQGIVQALKALNGRTNAESCELSKMKEHFRLRTYNVFEVKYVPAPGRQGHDAYQWRNTGRVKSPAPYGIKIYEGSSYIAGTREFCEYAVHTETAKGFLEWLNDTLCVDESFFSSLYRHPRVPGSVPGKQPEFITRGGVKWFTPGKQNLCYGYWLRGICVLSLPDLNWLFEPELQHMLFTQKIDFEYDEELVDCWYVKAQDRKQHPYSSNGISWNSPCAV